MAGGAEGSIGECDLLVAAVAGAFQDVEAKVELAVGSGGVSVVVLELVVFLSEPGAGGLMLVGAYVAAAVGAPLAEGIDRHVGTVLMRQFDDLVEGAFDVHGFLRMALRTPIPPSRSLALSLGATMKILPYARTRPMKMDGCRHFLRASFSRIGRPLQRCSAIYVESPAMLRYRSSEYTMGVPPGSLP